MGASDLIQAALDSHLAALELGPDLAWENVPFSPVVGRPWIRASFLPGPVIQAELAPAGGRNRHQGLYQVSLFYPAGQGSGPARGMAERVISGFKRGTVLNHQGIRVCIQRSWRGPALGEPDWFQVPVSVQWFAYTANE